MSLKDKVTHNGSGLVTHEYQISRIDEYGDIMDCDHTRDLDEARASAQGYASEHPAHGCIVEHVTRRYPLHLHTNEPVTHKIVNTYGSRDALIAGGWVD